jgi:hypothetical protein
MNPMMMIAALGAGMLFLLNRGQAAAAPPPDTRAQAPVDPGIYQEPVSPFEIPGDVVESPMPGPPEVGPGKDPYPPVQPGDRKGVTPRAEPKVVPSPKAAPRRGPSIVALTKTPSIR